MIVKAVQKNTRQTPRKLVLVANTVRGESLADAIRQLSIMDRRASLVILKVMRQAIANAMHNHQASFSDLVLKDIVINEGPRYRRWQAVSRGRAHGIIKRTSHITVILEIKGKENSKLPDSVGTGKTQNLKSKVKGEKLKTETTKTTKTPAKTSTKTKKVKSSTSKASKSEKTKKTTKKSTKQTKKAK